MSSDALPVANKGKRRLSNLGAANALAEVETDEFETTNLSPFGGIGRRKSSIAPKSPAKGSREYAKQEELAEKYRLIIKLSSENKISAKNSWSLDLIDNMGEMIMNDASASRGVNFQKASCTIDASVKIYSHRVDDTWTSSMRVLENLSRNAHDESDEEEEENNDGDINKEKVSAKVGSKAASRRLDVSRTIEKNVANINSAQIEHQCTVDPMFHKMSKAFDEGGAKGMLMANLRVVPNSSCIVFNAAGTTAEASATEEDASETVDLSYVLSNLDFRLQDLLSAPLAPVLDQYRQDIGITPSSEGVVVHTEASLETQVFRAPEFSFEPVASPCGAPAADMYDDDDNSAQFPSNNFEENDVDPADEIGFTDGSAQPHLIRQSLAAQRQSTPSRAKFDWGAVFDDKENVNAESGGGGDPRGRFHVDSGVSSADSFGFFDMASKPSNDWAGARHWKFALRARAPATAAAADKSEEPMVVVSKQKKSTRKEKVPLQFTAEPVEEGVFGPSSPKAEANLLSAAAIKKNAEAAESGLLTLPPDARLAARDLCRLFLRPRLIVMPEMLSSMLRPVRGRDQSKGVFNREEDVIWGEVRGGQQAQAQGQGLFSAEAVHAAEDDKVDYVFEDDDNDNDYSPPDDSDLLPAGEEQPRGLKIRMSGMLKATRTVQRIQVSYATTSKRVNVSKLKKDIWSHLDASIGAPPAADASRDQQDSSLSSSVSFHEVMDEVAREQQQSDVTVSFYFICLLHLANEKNLVITGCEAMDDLVVGCDCE